MRTPKGATSIGIIQRTIGIIQRTAKGGRCIVAVVRAVVRAAVVGAAAVTGARITGAAANKSVFFASCHAPRSAPSSFCWNTLAPADLCCLAAGRPMRRACNHFSCACLDVQFF